MAERDLPKDNVTLGPQRCELRESAAPAAPEGAICTHCGKLIEQCPLPNDDRDPSLCKGFIHSGEDGGHHCHRQTLELAEPAEPTPLAPATFGEWEEEVMRIVKATESFDPEHLEIYKAAATFAAQFAKYKLARAEQELKRLRELVRQLHAAQPYSAHTHPPKETCLHCEIEAALAKGSE